jgi:hypothetical protein
LTSDFLLAVIHLNIPINAIMIILLRNDVVLSIRISFSRHVFSYFRNPSIFSMLLKAYFILKLSAEETQKNFKFLINSDRQANENLLRKDFCCTRTPETKRLKKGLLEDNKRSVANP